MLRFKKVKLDQMRGIEDLPYLNLEDLFTWTAGWQEGSKDHVAGSFEIKRRQERPNEVRGWLAIVFSIVSIGIAIAAFLDKP